MIGVNYKSNIYKLTMRTVDLGVATENFVSWIGIQVVFSMMFSWRICSLNFGKCCVTLLAFHGKEV